MLKFRLKIILVLLIIGLSHGCVDRFAVLANPPAGLVNQVEKILPKAEKFVLAKQKMALSKGIPLSSELKEIAKKIGVKHPDKVRVYPVDTLPVPKDPELADLANRLGYSSPKMASYTYGYGIWVKRQQKNNRKLLIHELIHVRQAEQLGLKEQIRQYLLQLSLFGYRQAPMEIEAYSESDNFK